MTEAQIERLLKAQEFMAAEAREQSEVLADIRDLLTKIAARPVAAAGGGAASSLPLSGQVIPWGKSKGTPVEQATTNDLKYTGQRMAEDVNNPAKANYRDKNLSLLAAINTVLQSRGEKPFGAPGIMQADEPPRSPSRGGGSARQQPPGDEEIPF